MTAALLQDLTRCLGCRGCQVACKQWHDLPTSRTENRGSHENPADLSATTWTRIRFREASTRDGPRWDFVKVQCMHCRHPACVAVCTVGALTKSPRGPVLYDQDRCIGCRYCQYACPFGVPKYEWERALGLVRKCDLCVERLEEGLVPACAATCPTGAIAYGERADLLVEAHARIAAHPGRYGPDVYGEHEVGGTSVLYLLPVAPAALGLPRLPTDPPTKLAESVVATGTPVAFGVLVATLSAIAWLRHRSEEVRRREEET